MTLLEPMFYSTTLPNLRIYAEYMGWKQRYTGWREVYICTLYIYIHIYIICIYIYICDTSMKITEASCRFFTWLDSCPSRNRLSTTSTQITPFPSRHGCNIFLFSFFFLSWRAFEIVARTRKRGKIVEFPSSSLFFSLLLFLIRREFDSRICFCYHFWFRGKVRFFFLCYKNTIEGTVIMEKKKIRAGRYTYIWNLDFVHLEKFWRGGNSRSRV